MVFLKEFFEKFDFEKNQKTTKRQAKFSRGQRVKFIPVSWKYRFITLDYKICENVCNKDGKQRGMCIKGQIWPPWEPKTESCFSPISSNWFISRMVEGYNSCIYFTFSVAMVTKMAEKIGLK